MEVEERVGSYETVDLVENIQLDNIKSVLARDMDGLVD